LFVRLRQNNTDLTVARFSSSDPMSQWVDYSFRVKDFLTELTGIQLVIEACDFQAGHLVEAGIDLFKVDYFGFVGTESLTDNHLEGTVIPNPSNETAQLITTQKANNIKITDLSGRIVYTFNSAISIEQFQLPSNLQSGLYIIEFSSSAGKGITRWLKN
jgi:hypothetical protein